MEQTNSILSFSPALGFHGAHRQTIGAYMLRQLQKPNLFYRERLFTPDNDFIDLDYPTVPGYESLWQHEGDGQPIVLVLHGLEGSARRPYTNQMYRELAQQGIRAVGINYRSCSGEMNWTNRIYHAGFIDDVVLTIDLLRQRFPNTALGIVGFSLGGNITLNYLGKTANPHVAAAVSISSPFDLLMGGKVIDDGPGRFYIKRLRESLQEKTILKRALLDPIIDVERALAADTIYEFDDAFAPAHRFADAEEYYTATSSAQFIPKINRPTLIIRALDDPFLPQDRDIPWAALQKNDHISTLFPERGGHVGFMSQENGRFVYWSERQAARFLAKQLIK